MRDKKADVHKSLDEKEIQETLEDLKKEESDMEYAEEVTRKKKLNYKIRFRRPPKTSAEAMETLKEVDARYELQKHFLSGELYNPHTSLVSSEKAKQTEKDRQKRMLENVPEGITISKLAYPANGKLSTVILLGVKQRTIIHASYVSDFLAEFKPKSVFVQIPPDMPMFIKSSTEKPDHKSKWFSFLRRAADVRFFVHSRP